MKYYELWTEEEDRWLNDNRNAFYRRPQELADAFNSVFGRKRTAKAISQHCIIIGISAGRPRYTEEEIEYLKAHSDMNRRNLTFYFNRRFGKRSKSAITRQMSYRGFIKEEP